VCPVLEISASGLDIPGAILGRKCLDNGKILRFGVKTLDK